MTILSLRGKIRSFGTVTFWRSNDCRSFTLMSTSIKILCLREDIPNAFIQCVAIQTHLLSLLHSQVPATCPYPQPARSSLSPHIPLPHDTSEYYPPSTPAFSKWSLSLRFPHHNPLYFSILSPICAVCPEHLIILEIITRTILDEQYRSLSSSLCSFSPLPCYLVLLGPKYSSQRPTLKHSQLTIRPQCGQNKQF